MKTRYPVMWYEGMPLEPATFQQAQLNNEQTTAYLINNLNANNWGVTKLVIDEVYLAEGVFAVKELECALPDYSIISFTAGEQINAKDATMQLNLKERSDEFKNKELFVFLTLPSNHLSYASSVAKPRYVGKEEIVADLNSQDIEANVSFLAPNYELTLGENAPIGSISIPLAKIKFTGINFQLSHYAAPTLQLSNSPLLVAKLEQLVRSSRDKLKYLANKEDDTFNNKFLMMNLGRIVFPIESLLKNNGSPYALFCHLIESLGNALAFTKDNHNLPTVPTYNHADHIASVLPLVEYISAALEFVKESYKVAQFIEKDGIFGFILPENYTREKITIGIVKTADNTLDSSLKWITNAIITTEDKLTTMQDQRIIGAKRNSIKYSQTMDIKNTSDMIIVEVALDPAYITPNKMICIMNMDLPNTPEAINFFSENK